MKRGLLVLTSLALLSACGLPPDIVGPTQPRDPNDPVEQPPQSGS